MTFIAGQVLTAADLNSAIAGAGGLLLTGSATLSADSSKSLNNVFSSTYKTHRVYYSLATAASTANLKVTMRVAGVDNTSSNYADSEGTSGGAFMICGKANVGGGWGFFDVFNAAFAVPTDVVAQYGTARTAPTVGSIAAGHNVSAAYDGFTVTPSTSTLTGTIWVYGLVAA